MSGPSQPPIPPGGGAGLPAENFVREREHEARMDAFGHGFEMAQASHEQRVAPAEDAAQMLSAAHNAMNPVGAQVAPQPVGSIPEIHHPLGVIAPPLVQDTPMGAASAELDEALAGSAPGRPVQADSGGPNAALVQGRLDAARERLAAQRARENQEHAARDMERVERDKKEFERLAEEKARRKEKEEDRGRSKERRPRESKEEKQAAIAKKAQEADLAAARVAEKERILAGRRAKSQGDKEDKEDKEEKPVAQPKARARSVSKEKEPPVPQPKARAKSVSKERETPVPQPKSRAKSVSEKGEKPEGEKPVHNRRIVGKKSSVIQTQYTKPPAVRPKAEKPVEPGKVGPGKPMEARRTAPRPKIKAVPPRSMSPTKPDEAEGKKPRARSTSRTDVSIVDEVKAALRDVGRARSAHPLAKEPRIVLRAVEEIERSVTQGREKRAPQRSRSVGGKRARSVHPRSAIVAWRMIVYSPPPKETE